MMTGKLQQLMGLGALMAVLTGISPVSAHHSFAMYDAEKIVTVEGTVHEFKWTNPHVLLRVLAASPPGGTVGQVWTMELTAPGQLSRNGWTHATLKAGDAVKVQLRPFRDGRLGGAFVSVSVNGQEIKR
jgi:hypothetical protein